MLWPRKPGEGVGAGVSLSHVRADKLQAGRRSFAAAAALGCALTIMAALVQSVHWP